MQTKGHTLKSHRELLLRILLVFILFTCTRLLFLLFNSTYFEFDGGREVLIQFLAGARYDLSAIFILNTPVIALSLLPLTLRNRSWYARMVFIIFMIINSLALLANCIDMAYFPFTLKRTTSDIFSFIGIGGGHDFFQLLPRYLVDFWHIVMIWVIFVLILWYLGKRTVSARIRHDNRTLFFVKNTLILLLAAGLWVLGCRGGWQLRPLGIITAGENAPARNIPLVLNTPFTIIQTIGKEQLADVSYFSSKEALEAEYMAVRQYHQDPGAFRKKNVVIIILEGISREQMGFGNEGLGSGQYKGFTPFLDSLARQSLFFDHAFANSKKSIEGVPSILAGIPSMTESPLITGPYSGNALGGLPALLKPFGYSSAFFHGGTNGTMQLDAFAALAGFESYFGRTEYGNDQDFDGNWGIYDEEFLQFTANQINKLNSPFCTAIFTLSSHHPYKIPPRYRNKFPRGRLPIHESVGYADYSLQRFFHTISKMNWYPNTLFIITSDHTSPAFSEYYQNSLGNLAIPLLIFDPAHVEPRIMENVVQQIDILPSVLDFLAYPQPFVAFGESVYAPGRKNFSISYYNKIYQLITNDLLIQFNGDTVLAVYDIKKDPLLRNNLARKLRGPIAEERLMKAIIQTYNQRVKHNQLTLQP